MHNTCSYIVFIYFLFLQGVGHTVPTVQVHNEDDDDKSPLMRQPENYVT